MQAPPKRLLNKQQGDDDTLRGEEERGCMGDLT